MSQGSPNPGNWNWKEDKGLWLNTAMTAINIGFDVYGGVSAYKAAQWEALKLKYPIKLKYGASDAVLTRNEILMRGPAEVPMGAQFAEASGSGIENGGTFLVGVGDVVSFGATKWIRGQSWYGDCYVDYGSGWYTGGQVAGFGLSMATGAGIGRAGAAGAAKGLEFSHWIPARMGGARSLWNGKYVTAVEHALMDPFRYRLMPAAWKAANPMPGFVVQMWNRLPTWIYGTMGGAAYGTGSLFNQ